MKFLIVACCIFATLIPDAMSIECYVCNNKNGNCETGKMTCPSSIVTFDKCLKVKQGDAVAKSCSNSGLCDIAKKACENVNDCEASCCDSDLCNGGVPLKPVTFLTLVAMALGVAKYLM